MNAVIWRYCAACGWVGETTRRTCEVCATSIHTRARKFKPGLSMALQILPVPVEALKAAYRAGGREAVVAMIAGAVGLDAEELQRKVDESW